MTLDGRQRLKCTARPKWTNVYTPKLSATPNSAEVNETSRTVSGYGTMMSVYPRALVPTEARPDSREGRFSLGETARMDIA